MRTLIAITVLTAAGLPGCGDPVPASDAEAVAGPSLELLISNDVNRALLEGYRNADGKFVLHGLAIKVSRATGDPPDEWRPFLRGYFVHGELVASEVGRDGAALTDRDAFAPAEAIPTSEKVFQTDQFTQGYGDPRYATTFSPLDVGNEQWSVGVLEIKD